MEVKNIQTASLGKMELPQSLFEICRLYPKGICLSTAFGPESQILVHLIATYSLPIEVFTIDTGRLFDETHELWAKTEARYKLRIKAVFPNSQELQEHHQLHGANAFYKSKEKRLHCCEVRKVNPLKEMLIGKELWLSGLRREHSLNRAKKNIIEWNEEHGITKFYPLFHWTRPQVWEYIKRNNIPVNSLHNKGFRSIGCAPCTRATIEGEDDRAGRWWWEDGHKECGLHR